MKKTKPNRKEELHDLRRQCGLIDRIDCTDEENKQYVTMRQNGHSLPENVYENVDLNGSPIGTFYTEYPLHLSEEERREYIQLLQIRKLNAIKNCVWFLMIPATLLTFFLILFFLTEIF